MATELKVSASGLHATYSGVIRLIRSQYGPVKGNRRRVATASSSSSIIFPPTPSLTTAIMSEMAEWHI